LIELAGEEEKTIKHKIDLSYKIFGGARTPVRVEQNVEREGVLEFHGGCSDVRGGEGM